MNGAKYASLESQLGNAPCLCEDTEEMFWLRESDDYESRMKLGSLLSGQYRFLDALDAYLSAEKIRSDDPALYSRLGGVHLTLRHFDAAKKAYDRSSSLSHNEKTVAYPSGVWNFLQGRYREAANCFAGVLPCGDEMKIAVLYWHAIACMRGHFPDELLPTYYDGMEVGHHTAYQAAVRVFSGLSPAEDVLSRTEQEKEDLDAVIALYGLACYYEYSGNKTKAKEVRRTLLQRESVWPCISYLAAWNDQITEAES